MSTGVVAVRCNRCRKPLTVEASRIKGIGPVCEKRGLKSLGARAGQAVQQNQEEELLRTIEGIKMALFNDYEGSLDFYELHCQRIQQVCAEGGDHVELLGIAYEVLADVCNQMPGDNRVADATKLLFTVIGVPEEAEAAHKRLCRIVKKAGVL